jgi:catechol 2,3-dioxygenase-like lactoylglutathione lyase family enzyme
MALIHNCYRITDIDRSVAFYDALGFQEIARMPIGDEAINVFMDQPGDGDMPRLELTYNFGVDSYEIGTTANLDLYRLAGLCYACARSRLSCLTTPRRAPRGASSAASVPAVGLV